MKITDSLFRSNKAFTVKLTGVDGVWHGGFGAGVANIGVTAVKSCDENSIIIGNCTFELNDAQAGGASIYYGELTTCIVIEL
jgi:hypothetical protein